MQLFKIGQREFAHQILQTGIVSGNALGIWICGCSLIYKRELWASKSAGAKGDVPKICGFVRPLHLC